MADDQLKQENTFSQQLPEKTTVPTPVVEPPRSVAETAGSHLSAGIAAWKVARRMAAQQVAREAAGDANGVGSGAGEAISRADSSTGSPLPQNLQRKFEASTGADLSSVRVHTGEASATAAESVSAHAYTTGQDVHFAAGKYNPSSGEGEKLLAHEVAHTVQQRGSAISRQANLEVSEPGDGAEEEAEMPPTPWSRRRRSR